MRHLWPYLGNFIAFPSLVLATAPAHPVWLQLAGTHSQVPLELHFLLFFFRYKYFVNQDLLNEIVCLLQQKMHTFTFRSIIKHTTWDMIYV